MMAGPRCGDLLPFCFQWQLTFLHHLGGDSFPHEAKHKTPLDQCEIKSGVAQNFRKSFFHGPIDQQLSHQMGRDRVPLDKISNLMSRISDLKG